MATVFADVTLRQLTAEHHVIAILARGADEGVAAVEIVEETGPLIAAVTREIIEYYRARRPIAG